MPLFWKQMASLLGPPGPMAPQAIWLANPQPGERRILLRAPHALTISRLDAVLTGGTTPSVGVSLRHGADVSAAGTAVSSSPLTISSANGGSTTGVSFSALLNPLVPADHWLWLELTAVSGAPTGLALTLRFS
ncbi:MAG: hypothetical protein VKN83_10540 [Cyanobacteriota bacterium]|nr:hypothetical protein [Cyanobacteriota bacterium]